MLVANDYYLAEVRKKDFTVLDIQLQRVGGWLSQSMYLYFKYGMYYWHGRYGRGVVHACKKDGTNYPIHCYDEILVCERCKKVIDLEKIIPERTITTNI
jgi:hypothetical protein